MKLYSPSKLNIGLRILGRRKDGYHLLESIFWPISLCDEMEITSSPNTHVETTWASDALITEAVLPDSKNNLVTRLLENFPELGTWNISIQKRIPIGGGLGGSSSNAGTFLKYLILEKKISRQRASEIALTMGADVPFFLNPVPSLVEGIGEKITPLSISKDFKRHFQANLFLFPFGSDTKQVFSDFALQNNTFSESLRSQIEKKPEEYLKELVLHKNDLEAIVFKKHSQLQMLLHTLRSESSQLALMSGSGSTCFTASFQSLSPNKNAKGVEEICRKHHCRSIQVSTFEALHN